MKPNSEELRKKCIENPPEGMTSEDIRHMSEDNLLDMDFFPPYPKVGIFYKEIKGPLRHQGTSTLTIIYLPGQPGGRACHPS
ncbi:MAG TPA: hypothetical protein IAA04_03100 [Candidatus Lachnoclostridium pullistercoris]|uniref:Uncharacterized protein n=1 Tax=Candidatus Lachnoclostridium pullistercoris TaxID=2838632 RepID=A0A9D2T594_9FIRM|nr:hypothetical protein [Candidatus Lachnoclostridium pullistercoris]